VKEVLSQNEVKFVYMDITSGMLPLKTFLKIRDNNESHKEARENGRVGIPALSVDGETYILSGADDALRIIEELNLL
jgi:glutaredoxin-related protein